LSHALFMMACSRDDPGSVSPQPEWVPEELQPGMMIAFPRGYEGDGYRCGIDACYFHKQRPDHAADFGFPVSGMTGYHPAEFAVLPDNFQYKYRELIETVSGLEGAIYFTPEDENEFDWSLATFVVEAPEDLNYREVIWVTYKASHHANVRAILRTIDHEDALVPGSP